MDYCRLGKTGLKVSELCLGAMTFGRETSEEDSRAMLNRFIEVGGNFIDTANNYTDGTSDEIISDSAWNLSNNGPIRANNEYDGEEYDARREMPGWSSPGFNDSDWQRAQLVQPPGGDLAAAEANVLDVVGATRNPKPFGPALESLVAFGASPRATLFLVRGAQAIALMDGRAYVVPEDVQQIALDVLRHRIHVSYEAEAEGIDGEEVARRILEQVRVP